MKRLLLILVLLFSAFATEQVPEHLKYNNTTLFLHLERPLFGLWENHEDVPKFEEFFPVGWNTGCWRGYKGIWKIQGDSLLLDEIQSCEYDFHCKVNPDGVDSAIQYGLSTKAAQKIKDIKDTFPESEMYHKLDRHINRGFNGCLLDFLSFTDYPDSNVLDLDTLLKSKTLAFGKRSSKCYHATWYTGDLTIWGAPMLKEQDLFLMTFIVESGIITDTLYIPMNNVYEQDSSETSTVSMCKLSMRVPKKSKVLAMKKSLMHDRWDQYFDFSLTNEKGAFSIRDKSGSYTLEYISLHDNHRLYGDTKRRYLNKKVDEVKGHFPGYSFRESEYKTINRISLVVNVGETSKERVYLISFTSYHMRGFLMIKERSKVKETIHIDRILHNIGWNDPSFIGMN